MSVEAVSGSTVMETAVPSSLPRIMGESGGGRAGAPRPAFNQHAWVDAVGDPEAMEEDMLDFALDVRPNSRLSCQIRVRDDLDGLVVHTPVRQA